MIKAYAAAIIFLFSLSLHGMSVSSVLNDMYIGC